MEQLNNFVCNNLITIIKCLKSINKTLNKNFNVLFNILSKKITLTYDIELLYTIESITYNEPNDEEKNLWIELTILQLLLIMEKINIKLNIQNDLISMLNNNKIIKIEVLNDNIRTNDNVINLWNLINMIYYKVNSQLTFMTKLNINVIDYNDINVNIDNNNFLTGIIKYSEGVKIKLNKMHFYMWYLENFELK
jgi:hypothetical protein